MKFNEDQIHIVPHYYERTWQSCDYFVGNTHLFHERTYHTNLYGKNGLLSKLLKAKNQTERDAIAAQPDKVSCQFGGQETKEKIEQIAIKHGGYAKEAFYTEGVYFLEFDDTDKAIAFCQTEDFDKLCLTMDKVGG